MVFSPRLSRSSRSVQGKPIQGVPVEDLSQQLLSQQVTTLLNTVQILNKQVEKRDHLLEFAKTNCKKRFVQSLEKQHDILRQPSAVGVSEFLYLGQSDHADTGASDVAILENEQEEEDETTDSVATENPESDGDDRSHVEQDSEEFE